ncbi:MAG: Xaa-Pro peptidase family protein [Atopobiaceae bacterium]|nr:Xaa-Pro peptidase family protein [Atopobiaceae bacterium]
MSDTTVFAQRVERLRSLMEQRGYDAVVLRNNPDLRWLTGARRVFDDEVAHTAFVTAESLYLHTDSRYYNSFIEKVGTDAGWRFDMEFIGHAQWVAQRILSARARVVAIEDTCDLAFYDDLQHQCALASIAPVFPRLHGDICDLRMVKDEDEIALLRRAQEITDEAFEYICTYIKPGMTEQQIRAELENYMLSHGADGLSFESIIASGPNGANPHARPGSRVVGEGDFIVMDYGALYQDYHADMTRTVCLGEPSDEQRRVYEIVKQAHEQSAAAVRPDVIGADIHNISVKVISDAGYGDYYGHGLGHGVGIQIHERPNFGIRWKKPVPLGSVVTIEPGIYLPGKFGIRLEDCGVVTENGYEPFTASSHELRVIPV